MNEALGTLPILVPLVIVGVVLTVYCKRKLARRRKLARVAAELGLRSGAADDEVLSSALGSLPAFRTYYDGKLVNVMGKKLGAARLTMFEFRVRIRGGDRNYRIRSTGFYVSSSGLDLPSFVLNEHGLMDKIISLFTWAKLDFGQHPIFAKRYSLSGEDSERLGALFDEDLVSFFEGRIRPPDKIGIPGIYYQREYPLPYVEAQGKGFIYLPGGLIAPDDIPALLLDLEKLLELLAGSVDSRAGGQRVVADSR